MPSKPEPSTSLPGAAAAPTAPRAATRQGKSGVLGVLRSAGRILSTVFAVGYVLCLLAAIIAFRTIGENWWVTTVALYLPRAGFALPLPVMALSLAICGPRPLLLLCPVALVLVLFPLMGLEVKVGSSPATAAPGRSLRVLSCNAWYGRNPEAMAKTLQASGADLILLQEFNRRTMDKALTRTLGAYHRHAYEEFFFASRYPLRAVEVAGPLDLPPPHDRYPMFVHYTVEGPFGALDVFNTHPLSPRKGLNEIRGAGVLDELRELRLYRPEGIAAVIKNTAVRRAQVDALADHAQRATLPTIIAGDTNLPSGSWLLRQRLGRFRDGFEEVGHGFGYTFPGGNPWMRIDRILTSEKLGFRNYEAVASDASDHLCVIAELAPASP